HFAWFTSKRSIFSSPLCQKESKPISVVQVPSYDLRDMCSSVPLQPSEMLEPDFPEEDEEEEEDEERCTKTRRLMISGLAFPSLAPKWYSQNHLGVLSMVFHPRMRDSWSLDPNDDMLGSISQLLMCPLNLFLEGEFPWREHGEYVKDLHHFISEKILEPEQFEPEFRSNVSYLLDCFEMLVGHGRYLFPESIPGHRKYLARLHSSLKHIEDILKDMKDDAELEHLIVEENFKRIGQMFEILGVDSEHIVIAQKEIEEDERVRALAEAEEEEEEEVEEISEHEYNEYENTIAVQACCPIPGDAPNIKSANLPTIKAIDGTKEGKLGYNQSYTAKEMENTIAVQACCPIPGDAPNIKSANLPTIKAIDGTKEGKLGYNQSYTAKEMVKGEYNEGDFTHISIPFSSSSPMKGAYISLYGRSWASPPSHLIFTLTSSKGEKTSKKYEFPEFIGYHWYFLPVDLPDVVLCEITGKGIWRGRKKKSFTIQTLFFIREETPEEIESREAKEKLWREAQVVKPEFVKKGRRYSIPGDEYDDRISIPIPRDDPKVVDPSFSMVKCKDDAYRKESEEYDKSSEAQRMLKGEDDVVLSHLSIPFPSPSPLKGAYICVDNQENSPSLLFAFTDDDGKKTCKKYDFTKPDEKKWQRHEWYFLPIDLDNVVLCEIEGKGSWMDKKSVDFYIESLIFIRGDDI
ncbi:hypothetical protein ADUPG1_011458, partial [Aduncisulcus paluster]